MVVTALRGRKHVVLGVAGLLLIGALVAWRVFRVSALMHIGAGYAAQQTCACVFVGGRALDSCMTDLEPLARVLVRVRLGQEEVTARALVETATARYEKGFGCSLGN